MGIAENNRFLPVHTAILMLGFLTLAIYGFVFRLWPAMKEGAWRACSSGSPSCRPPAW